MLGQEERREGLHGVEGTPFRAYAALLGDIRGFLQSVGLLSGPPPTDGFSRFGMVLSQTAFIRRAFLLH